MAKKIVAVTGIKHSGGFVNAGEALNPADFTKEELRGLHDSGAVQVVDDSKPEDVQAKDLTPEQLGTENAQTQDVSAAAKESTAAAMNKGAETESTPAKAAPAKK